MRFPAPFRLGQPASPRYATCPSIIPSTGRLIAATGLAARGFASFAAAGLLISERAEAQDLHCVTPPDGGPVELEICEIRYNGSDYLLRSDGSIVEFPFDTDVSPRDTSAAGLFFAGDYAGFLTGPLRARFVQNGPDVSIEVDYLGDLRGKENLPRVIQGQARGINSDGTVVVGWSREENYFPFVTPNRRAFRWEEGFEDGVSGNPRMQDLGVLDGDNWSEAFAVNADGSVIVGLSDRRTGAHSRHRDTGGVGFRWTQETGMQSLGILPGGSNSYALSVDASGNTIVGWSESANGMRGFVWSKGTKNDDGSNSILHDLGTLPGGDASRALDVDASGNMIVGWSESPNGRRAVRWASDKNSGPERQIQSLGVINSVASSDEEHESYSEARTVNSDGSVIMGVSGIRTAEGVSDRYRGSTFIWRTGTMLDHANTGVALQQSAQALAATAAHYGQNTVYQLDREVALRSPGGGDGPNVSTRGHAAPQRPVAVRVGGRLEHTDDVATSGGAEVTAAVGLTPTLTLGGFVEITGESDSHSVVSLDGTHVAGGASLRYRAAPDGTGLTWRVAAVRGGGDFDVTRRDILPNTERGEGATSLTTTGLSAEIGYGYAVPLGVVTPFARLTGSRVERDGFAETNAIAFPLTYDDHEDEALTLTLGADARLDVSEQGTLELGAGISHDLDRDTDPVTGTSAIPGFTDFSVDGPDLDNRTRGYVSAGYSHALGAGRAVTGRVSVSQSPWTDDLSIGARVGYEMRF